MYSDLIDLTACVTKTRGKGASIGIALEDGREIEAALRPEEEQMMAMALKSGQTTKVRLVGRGEFSDDGKVQRIYELKEIRLLPDEDGDANCSKPIWDEFEAIIQTVPKGELERLPADGAEHHDLYISKLRPGSK